MKIIALVFAGGNKYSFTKFSKNVNDFVVLEYPGRGSRFNETLITNIDLLIEDLLPKITEEIKNGEEYIIYGHSMGALLGYSICHRLQQMKIKQPLKLVVSGRRAPSSIKGKILSDLPDDLFWQEVIKLGGIPDELKEHSELIEFYLPILRADFKVVYSYNYERKEKLNIPIDIFHGTMENMTENEIMDWKNESNREVIIKSMEGNHFFIFNHTDYFIDYFNGLVKGNINTAILKN